MPTKGNITFSNGRPHINGIDLAKYYLYYQDGWQTGWFEIWSCSSCYLVAATKHTLWNSNFKIFYKTYGIFIKLQNYFIFNPERQCYHGPQVLALSTVCPAFSLLPGRCVTTNDHTRSQCDAEEMAPCIASSAAPALRAVGVPLGQQDRAWRCQMRRSVIRRKWRSCGMSC